MPETLEALPTSPTTAGAALGLAGAALGATAALRGRLGGGARGGNSNAQADRSSRTAMTRGTGESDESKGRR